jgi:hypothetical protein
LGEGSLMGFHVERGLEGALCGRGEAVLELWEVG